MKITLLFITAIAHLFILSACESYGKKSVSVIDNTSTVKDAYQSPEQIGQYVIELFEDSKGNLWFGTIEKGVAKFDGETLVYFTTKDGLPSNFISSLLEDESGNLWIGTHDGLSYYDGKSFENYTVKDGLCDNRISSLSYDKSGRLWISTWNGLCIFDGKTYTPFTIPLPEVAIKPNKDLKNSVYRTLVDSRGDVWYDIEGYGLMKDDGKILTSITTKDGLLSNSVQAMVEDDEGNYWIGTRVVEKDNPDPAKRKGKGGLSKFNGKIFTHFPEIKGLSGQDVYGVYKDRAGNIWISTTSNGIYKYDGDSFTNYKVKDENQVGVMGFLEDSTGRLWLGCAGGLYRLKSDALINVTTVGPWF